MPSVGIVFEIKAAETVPGEAIRVVGAGEELGDWDPLASAGSGRAGADADVLLLKTGVLSYPHWSMTSPVWIRCGQGAEEDEESEAEEDEESELSTMDSFGNANPPTPRADSTGSSSEGLSPAVKRARVERPDLAPSGTQACAGMVRIEYKFLKDLRQLADDSGKRFKWEESIENRCAVVPAEAGSMWLISDALWDVVGPPSVERISQADVVSRCVELDPEHTLGRNKVTLASALTARCAYSLSPCSTPRRKMSCFSIEDEFEALAKKSLPTLLAEKLAAETTANELATEVMGLQREIAVSGAAKQQAEDEAKSMRDEVAHLKEAIMTVVHRLETTSQEHSAEIQDLHEENSALQAENRQLTSGIEEVRSELAGARAATASAEEARKQHAAEAARLSKENVELQQANASLRCLLAPYTSVLPEHLAPEASPSHSRPQEEERAGGSQEPCYTAPRTPRACRSTSEGGIALPEDAAAKSARLKKLLLQARSSLSSAQNVEKVKEVAPKEQEETELMKALRRRREKLQSSEPY